MLAIIVEIALLLIRLINWFEIKFVEILLSNDNY